MTSRPQDLLTYIRAFAGVWRDDPRDDAELLARFVETRDERAFSTLMFRHGPMVWRSCSRVLGNSPDAEDAFQSTFLTMSRQAAKLRAGTLAGWLHRIARRAALNLTAAVKRRQKLEQHLKSTPQSEFAEQSETAERDRVELNAAVDEELANLPEKIRIPLLLHYLEGKSQVEVARILGCARNALQKRLAKGESILRERLERRGLTLGAISLVTLLGGKDGLPAVPARLIENTARAAVAFRSGTLTGASAEGAEKLLRSLSLNGFLSKSWWLALMCIGSLGIGGAGLVAWKMFGDGSEQKKSESPAVSVVPESVIKPYGKQVDLYGDPLPKGAIARIGTVRFRGLGTDDFARALREQIVFSDDGNILALSCRDNGNVKRIFSWDISSGKELPENVGKSIFENSDKEKIKKSNVCGEIIVTAGTDRIVRVSDVKTGKEIRQLGVMKHVPTLISFLPDKKLVVACSGQVCFWDASTGKEARPPLICKGLLYPAILSPDGTKLIERVGNAISIWDLVTGKETGPTAGATRSLMNALEFSPDGKNLITVTEPTVTETGMGCKEGWQGRAAFQVWETIAGKPLGSLLIPDSIPVNSLVRVFWPLRDTILAEAMVSEEGLLSKPTTLRWLGVSPDKDTAKVEMYSDKFYLSPDGQIHVTRKNEIECLEEIATGKKIATVPYQAVAQAGLVFSPDHRTLAIHNIEVFKSVKGKGIGAITARSTITLREVSTGRELYSFNLPVTPDVDPSEPDSGPTTDSLITFSPDGRLLATINEQSGVINLWEHVSGQQRFRLTIPRGFCKASLAFSPDGNLLAISSLNEINAERSIHVWNLITGQECRHFQGHRASKGWMPVKFSPDSKRLASAGGDYTVLIWDVKQLPISVKASEPLDEEEMLNLKNALSGLDAAAAYQAIQKLKQVPYQAIPFVEDCLRPGPLSCNPSQIVREVDRLIRDLDSDDFQTRQKATMDLKRKLHAESANDEPIVEITLRQVLSGKSSVEVRNAVKQLLNKEEEERSSKGWGGARSSELRRMLRGIEILERINNSSAREVLRKLVESPPRPDIRSEAQAALQRLSSARSNLPP